jgi:hypothetical protein
MKLVAAAVASAMSAATARAQTSLPDPRLTPGAVNADVAQETISRTICVRGWTRTVRPPQEYTYALKRRQIASYTDQQAGDYEEDHLIPLSLGGAPYDPRNLWPEPRYPADAWNADDKNELEAKLNRLVCRHRMLLRDAQAAIASNWQQAYTSYVTGE